jgi:hypothetical protein
MVTIFAAFVVLDERRMKKGCGDCFGACLCPPTSLVYCRGKAFADKDGNEKQSIVRVFLREYYGPFLMKLPVKIIAILCFAALLGVNIYG